MIGKRIFLSKSYVIYWFKAKTRFKIHSPFVFDLVENVLRDKKRYTGYDMIDRYKRKLSLSKSEIETIDYGKMGAAGEPATYKVKLGKLVRLRSQRKKQARLLYRLTQKFKPETLLEMGTAAGFSASYLKFPVPESKMISLDGCPNLAAVAQNTFNELNVENIEVRTGNFEQTLPDVLREIKALDFVFFDGNHKKEATLNYFSQCMERVTEKSIFVFDDIHWSPGMAVAWEAIKNDPRVTLSIDLFWLGLVFFRKGSPKQDFVIRY